MDDIRFIQLYNMVKIGVPGTTSVQLRDFLKAQDQERLDWLDRASFMDAADWVVAAMRRQKKNKEKQPKPAGAEISPPGPPTASPRAQSQARETNFLAVASLVLGISSILLGCSIVMGCPLGIAAIITGYAGRRKAMAEPGSRNEERQALAGMVLGGASIAVGIITGVCLMVVWSAGVMSSGGSSNP